MLNDINNVFLIHAKQFIYDIHNIENKPCVNLDLLTNNEVLGIYSRKREKVMNILMASRNILVEESYLNKLRSLNSLPRCVAIVLESIPCNYEGEPFINSNLLN